jgi:hypothetical protein
MERTAIMSEEKQATVWRTWGSVVFGGIILLLVGFEAGAEGMRMKTQRSDAAVTEASAKVEEATQTLAAANAEIGKLKKQLGEESSAGQQTIGFLQQQLKETREALRRSAQAGGEAVLRCPQWDPSLPRPDATAFTVLYESGRAQVNISLLPLPGAPRIALGPGSQLAPRWIVPGHIQPRMVGETRQAIYYYFDASSNAWQGPFAPLRVTQ